MAYRSLVEVLAGVKYLPRYAALLTSSSPSFRYSSLREALEENDVFGSVFCAPATPKKRALVRFTVNASLTAEQIDHVLSACARIRTEVGMAGWASTRRRKGYRSMAVAAE